VDDALARLRDLRDGTVVSLSWAVSAEPGWQRASDAYVIGRAEQAFRDEAAYRSAVGESDGRLSEQATAVLAAYR
jgi:hypothetical protein